MDHFTVASCVTTCLIIFTILCILLKFGRRRDLSKRASKFPGPPTLPIIGNAHLFAGTTEDILNRIIQLSKLYPTPYRFWMGNYLTFVVNTSEQLKVVLLSPKTHDKGDLFDFVQPWLGTGLLTASTTKWRVHRKLIQPTFSSTILNSFVEIFAARSVKVVKKLEQNLDEPEFDVYNYTSKYTLYTICDTTMGVKLETQPSGKGSYADILEQVIASVCRRCVSPWLHPNFIFRRTQIGKDQKKNIKFLHAFTNNVIQAKHKELREQSHRSGLDNNEEDTNSGIPQRKIFLDHLLKLSNGDNKILSDEALREEVDTIMVAGSDTTAIISSYVMLMLASHPEVQDKIYRELCEIYQDYETVELQVTSEDLTRMVYMERAIKETMRLFPITPFLVRNVADDLDIGEHTLPAGSLVVLSIIEIHRNGDIWPDPLTFDPDRFLPEEVKKRDSYTYLPFSGGPRTCIGLKYAMMSMKTLLATILQKYILKKDNITPVKDLRFKWEFLLRPVDPITLRIEKRSENIFSTN